MYYGHGSLVVHMYRGESPGTTFEPQGFRGRGGKKLNVANTLRSGTPPLNVVYIAVRWTVTVAKWEVTVTNVTSGSEIPPP